MENIEMLGKFCDNKYIIGSNYSCKITNIEKEYRHLLAMQEKEKNLM